MHAATPAAQMKIRRVIVPRAPAHFSAWGMLMTDLRADWVRTRVFRSDDVDVATLNELWGGLEEAAVAYFGDEGVAESAIRFVRAADLRYKGQEHTVKVAVGTSALTERDLASLDTRFHEMHEQQYTFRLDVPIEFVNFHLAAFGAVDKPNLAAAPEHPGNDVALKGMRTVDFDELG